MTRYGTLVDTDARITRFDLCRDSSHIGRSPWSGWQRLPTQAHDGTLAVSIVANVAWDFRSTTAAVLLCRRHAGTDKGAITRNTYSGSHLILIEGGDVSSREVVEAQVSVVLHERMAAAKAALAAKAASFEAQRPGHLVDRLVERPGFPEVAVGYHGDFNTGIVELNARTLNKLSPGQARHLANKLLLAADKAAIITGP